MNSQTRKALLVVDVQNDFCPGGALAVPYGDEVVQPLNKTIAFARQHKWPIFASRDWHPRQTKHFKAFGGLWPVHCIRETPGAAFHSELHVQNATIISKATNPDEDGYSPFEGRILNDLMLEFCLRISGVEEIYIGGLATDYCVKAAVLDALKLGFKVFLLEDACRAVNLNPDDGKNAIEEMKKAGAIITTTEGVIQ